MKSKRKNIITVLAMGGLLAFGPSLLAQDATNTPPPNAQGGVMRGQNIDRRIQMLATQLNLTTNQQVQLKPILQSQMQQMAAVRQDSTLSPEDRRSKMMAIRQDIMNQIQGVLTPDQFTQYQQMMQRRRQNMVQGGPGGTNAPAASTPAAPGTPPPQQ